ncbi:unnamed protein product [Hydatigera taeniaeformis]|uniref:Lethal giant larvae homologue 2 domain-containing protein n=1 Tax=Hydatigena taeniaeformis TaxID=6205 RepID=A0A3P7HJA4_HYDTA|nr:unnamed protein product [Hydatigera taeniaeformis]
MLELPYLNCLHASSLTAYGLFTQVNPAFLEGLESLGGRADASGRVSRATGLSTRPWPIRGGGVGDEVSETAVPSNDLLITGHENGMLQFWRLGAGGCARKIFGLFTGSLFEGDFGPDATGAKICYPHLGVGGVSSLELLLSPTCHDEATHRAGEEESEPWPPFRRVGLFDPFMDDVRAAIKAIDLVDNTLVIGGAAGQTSVWQLAPTKPTMATLDVPVAPEVPGFRWKGCPPLTLRKSQLDQSQRLPGASLFPLVVALCQPPSPITCLSVCELADFSATQKSSQPSLQASTQIGVLVGMGTAHGFALMHVKPTEGGGGGGGFVSHLLLHCSTIPSNAEALEEAAVGEGWARRRTRELKNSLRDSFRRLKRMKSGRSTMAAVATSGSSTSAPQATSGSTSSPSANRLNYSARVGLRKSVTRSASSANQGIQIRGDPLQEALSRIHADSEALTSPPLPTGCEREICDRPTATANTALVRCMAFGPPLHHRLRPPAVGSTTSSAAASIETPQLLGSFFAATAGGAAFVFALFADNVRRPSHLASRQATHIQLQHRAPIVALRLIDTKTHCPLLTSSIYLPPFCCPLLSPHHQPPPPHLMVISEEQVRLFALPSISLRQKARITAKDGFRIKAGNIIAFGQFSNEPNMGIYGIEFNCVFINNGGQAVVLSVPYLRRRDTIALLGGGDVLEINSVAFATAGSTRPKVIGAPSLGLYQTAPGQLAMFDVLLASQRSSALGTAYQAVGLTKVAKHNTPSPSSRLQHRLVKPPTNADTPNVCMDFVSTSENAGFVQSRHLCSRLLFTHSLTELHFLFYSLSSTALMCAGL